MAWTTPRTWVATAILTAAQLNTDLRDNLNSIIAATDPPTANLITRAAYAKAWVEIDVAAGVPTIGDNYNIDTITDGGAGDFNVNFDTDFASAAYVGIGTVKDFNTGNANARTQGHAASTCRLRVIDAGNGTDPDGGGVQAVFFGAQ